MKLTSTATILLALLSAFPARADITMVQDTIVNGVSSRSTMWIKGDKARSDNGTTSSVIINAATGDMTTLMHDQKMVVTMNTKQLQALAAQVPGQEAGAADAAVSQVTATGEKETVDGHECEIYRIENQGMVVKLWVAKNYPNQEKLREQLKILAQLSAPGAPKQPDVPGIAVKTEFEQQGLKFTTKLVSLSDGPVSDDVFVIPAGYKAP
ncbi:MAG: DUF4412 domain-containing protein [Verrucomicrobiales bacterium]|nr:DUF4412 domain-containing protein [Verrucomicrobiales bacterium]